MTHIYARTCKVQCTPTPLNKARTHDTTRTLHNARASNRTERTLGKAWRHCQGLFASQVSRGKHAAELFTPCEKRWYE